MLEIRCDQEIINEVESSVLQNLGIIGIKEVEKTDFGLVVKGEESLYYGTPEYDDGKLYLVENGVEPAKLLEKVKSVSKNIGIYGSLQFGDDDYRPFFLFDSKPGTDDVSVDYAVGCTEGDDSIGIPLSSCAYHYTSWTDYGPEFFAIKTDEQVCKAAEVLKEFQNYLSENDGDPEDLWYEFVDDYESDEDEEENDFEDEWRLLCAVNGSELYMDQEFIDHFFSEFNKNHL